MATRSSDYGLYQWVGSDPVSRTQMNENFALLEQAMASRRTHHALGSVTLSTAASVLELDLSDVDWSAWHEVVVEVVNHTVSPAFYVTANDLSVGTSSTSPMSYNDLPYTGGGCALGHAVSGNTRITLLTHRDPDAAIIVRTEGSARMNVGAAASMSWEDLTKLVLRPDPQHGQTIPAGTAATVWGID